MVYAIVVIVTCLVVWWAVAYTIWQAAVNYKRQRLRNRVRGYYILK